MNDRPLVDRLNTSSRRALLVWCIGYAINHREEINPEAIARMSRGNQAERRAAGIIGQFGALDIPGISVHRVGP
jgi:hypothetical protein